MASEPLVMWTVYDHPSDFPHCYVARCFLIRPNEARATDDVIFGPNLQYIRHHLNSLGLSRIERDPTDDPKILETWL